jgi:hypothetical protein
MGGGPPHERGSQAVPDLLGLDDRFDSTRDFSGEREGLNGVGVRPWFLASMNTRDLAEAKRRRLDGGNKEADLTSLSTTVVPSTGRRLIFSDTVHRQPEGDGHHARAQVDTALDRFLQAPPNRFPPRQQHVRENTGTPGSLSTDSGNGRKGFACLRELQDLTNPFLPSQ